MSGKYDYTVYQLGLNSEGQHLQGNSAVSFYGGEADEVDSALKFYSGRAVEIWVGE